MEHSCKSRGWRCIARVGDFPDCFPTRADDFCFVLAVRAMDGLDVVGTAGGRLSITVPAIPLLCGVPKPRSELRDVDIVQVFFDSWYFLLYT